MHIADGRLHKLLSENLEENQIYIFVKSPGDKGVFSKSTFIYYESIKENKGLDWALLKVLIQFIRMMKKHNFISNEFDLKNISNSI